MASLIRNPIFNNAAYDTPPKESGSQSGGTAAKDIFSDEGTPFTYAGPRSFDKGPYWGSPPVWSVRRIG